MKLLVVPERVVQVRIVRSTPITTLDLRAGETQPSLWSWFPGHQLLKVNSLVILLIPGCLGSRRKRLGEVNLHRQNQAAARTSIELQPSIALTAASQDEHHGPIGIAKAARKRLLVGIAGLWRIAGVRMHPDPRKSLRRQARIDLPVKVIGHRLIIEADRDFTAELLDETDVFHQQQIVLGRDAKASYFR